MRWSLEAGRLPSLLGRELFRAKITAYTATTFESRVIFLHWTWNAVLDRLQDFDRQLIARVCLQEYDQEAAARILQCNRKTLGRRLPELIDELGSEAFLKAGLLERLPETKGGGPMNEGLRSGFTWGTALWFSGFADANNQSRKACGRFVRGGRGDFCGSD